MLTKPELNTVIEGLGGANTVSGNSDALEGIDKDVCKKSGGEEKLERFVSTGTKLGIREH